MVDELKKTSSAIYLFDHVKGITIYAIIYINEKKELLQYNIKYFFKT